MKIAMLSASMSRQAGGLFEAMRHLSPALERQPQTEVTVIAGADEFSFKDRVSWGATNLHINEVWGPKAFGWQPWLMERLVQEDPDVVHLNGLWMYPSYAALRWSQSRRRPRIVSPHGMLDPWALASSSWKKRVVRIAYEDRNLKGAAVLHALCKAEHDAMRALGLRNPIAIIPNGVNTDVTTAVHFEAPWADHVPEGTRVLLFLGRLHPKKGLISLLHAMSLVPDFGAWRLIVVGWDEVGHRAELEALVIALNLQPRVYFVGPLHGTEKNAAFASADAFILPSFSEGLPIAVLEAWAFGLPVLMTAECNLPDSFERGAAIQISNEPYALAAALRDLAYLSDGELATMGEKGRQLVAECYAWDRIAAELRAVCLWATGEGPVPESIYTVGQ